VIVANRQIKAVFANFKAKGQASDGTPIIVLRSKNRGDTIDTDTLADGELERLERSGSFVPVGLERPAELLEEAMLRSLNAFDVVRETGQPLSVSPPSMGVAPRGDYTTGDTGIVPVSDPLAVAEIKASPLPRTDAPDVEDTAALSEFIKTGGDAQKALTVPETVALAEGDAERAKLVLEAEKAATGQDPRKGVEAELQKIIEGGGGQ
jgi:hypothetical protein